MILKTPHSMVTRWILEAKWLLSLDKITPSYHRKAYSAGLSGLKSGAKPLDAKKRVFRVLGTYADEMPQAHWVFADGCWRQEPSRVVAALPEQHAADAKI